jgi:hypothetical protein
LRIKNQYIGIDAGDYDAKLISFKKMPDGTVKMTVEFCSCIDCSIQKWGECKRRFSGKCIQGKIKNMYVR